MTEASQLYVIALGSNRRHSSHGRPRKIVAAAIARLRDAGTVIAQSRIVASAPLGPSRRRFANGAALLRTGHAPTALFAELKAIEASFGRRRARRWGERVIDLDIVLWSRGIFADPSLTIPHPAYRARRFVIDPVAQIAPDWRDPLTGLTMRQLAKRLSAPKLLDPGPAAF